MVRCDSSYPKPINKNSNLIYTTILIFITFRRQNKVSGRGDMFSRRVELCMHDSTLNAKRSIAFATNKASLTSPIVFPNMETTLII